MHFVRAKKISTGFDMSPLIDCILQLLIFFMLTSSFSGGAISLALPKAGSTDLSKPDELVVSVNAAGDVFVGTEQIAIGSLMERLRRELESSPHTTVSFRGDEAIPYRTFVEVMDRVKRAGVQHFRIAHAPLPDRRGE